MNRGFARRLLATFATGALMTLPATAAVAKAPDHANAAEQASTASDHETGPPEHANDGGNGGSTDSGNGHTPDNGGGGEANDHQISEDEDGDASNEPDHEFEESLHPSGKDRTDHQDKPQGNAQSDPDDDGVGMDRNGTGEDKPGAGGGVYTDDQDGNNGCGNDQDFEDDNNGWCGRPPVVDEGPDEEPEAPAEDETDETDEVDEVEEVDQTDGVDEVEQPDEVDVAADVVIVSEEDTDEAEVLGVVFQRPAPAAASDDAEVLGAAQEDTLPATGVSALALGISGLLALGGGEILRRGTR